MHCSKGMDRISVLPDEVLVKILSYVPTKAAVSTSTLSKRWESLWMWVPNFNHEMTYGASYLVAEDFLNKNLPLLKAQVLESFRLHWNLPSFHLEDVQRWVRIAISRCVREVDIDCGFRFYEEKDVVVLPSSLYTCKSLVSLKLAGHKLLVDVPETVSLPALKTLVLNRVTYLNGDCFRLLLSYCPVLEDLTIERSNHDNVRAIVVISPSLQRLSLPIESDYSCDEFVIITPFLKYIKVENYSGPFAYMVKHMPKVEEADIVVDECLQGIFESIITSVKRLSLSVLFNIRQEYMYRDGILFKQLEQLKLCIRRDYWSKLLFRLLQDSPKLRVLKLYVDIEGRFKKYKPISWDSNQSSVPKCLLTSLETFEFAKYRGKPEERDFVSYIIKNACCLKSSSITPCFETEYCYSSSSASET